MTRTLMPDDRAQHERRAAYLAERLKTANGEWADEMAVELAYLKRLLGRD